MRSWLIVAATLHAVWWTTLAAFARAYTQRPWYADCAVVTLVALLAFAISFGVAKILDESLPRKDPTR